MKHTILLALSALPLCASETPPNVIIILTDDSGYTDLSCYGGEIPTPNIDRLAAEGMRFTQFHNASRCMPTRAALMAGNYNHMVGCPMMEGRGSKYDETTGERIGPVVNGALLRETPTIAEVLKHNGYQTFHTGKWHLGEQFESQWPLQRGFDKFYGTIKGATPNKFNGTGVYEGNEPIQKPVPDDWYIGNAITDKALEYIRNRDKSKPFFLYHAPLEPHWPWTATEEDVAPFKGKYGEGYEVTRQCRLDGAIEKGVIPPGTTMEPYDPFLPPWEVMKTHPDAERLIGSMEHHAGMMKNIDDNVGRIVAELEKEGILDNTIIMYLSDNGGEMMLAYKGDYRWIWPTVLNAPFRVHKTYQHQGGIATHFIVRWPDGGVPANTINTKQVGHVKDIMATIIEATDAEFPETNLGIKTWPHGSESLLSAMRDPDYAEPRTYFFEHNGRRAVRQGKWKAVMVYNPIEQIPGYGKGWDHVVKGYEGKDGHVSFITEEEYITAQALPKTGQWELYDMEADPTEMKNLAEQHPEKVAELSALFDGFLEKSGFKIREVMFSDRIEAGE